MSNVAITALPAATSAALTDVFPFVLLSGPTTSKITLANIKTSLVLVKGDVGLGNVENTALSTWTGSSNVVTTGALTGGSTGAGFTVALSVATVTGTLPSAAFPATLPVASGVNLTALTAANITASSTVGRAVLALTNPSAITFLRFNADNTVSALNAADFKTALSIATFDPNAVAITGGTINGASVGVSVRGRGDFEPLNAFGVATFWDGLNIKFTNTLNIQDGTMFLNSGGIGMNASKVVTWGPDAGVVSSSPDIGLERSSAGVLKVTDGAGGFGVINGILKMIAAYGGATPVVGSDPPTEWIRVENSSGGDRLLPLWAVPA